jgi:hypothetical protein
MAVVLRFGQAALLRCRFAVSPLHEATDALRSLIRAGRPTTCRGSGKSGPGWRRWAYNRCWH